MAAIPPDLSHTQSSEELFADLPNGCRICYQTFGRPVDPAILLISGFGASMTYKIEQLIPLLNQPSQHYIICFDHRDTGRSSSFPMPADGTPAYSFDDMIDDVVGLILHLSLEQVHLVGASMGGPIAWSIAGVRLPQKVKSLTLLFTSPVGPIQNDSDGLPPMKQDGPLKLASAIHIPADLDDDAAWIDMNANVDLVLATHPPTDEDIADAKRRAELTYRRERESGTMWTKLNHQGAAMTRWPRERLEAVRCPVMVIHAAGDQFYAIEHAEALRDGVGGQSDLVVIQDCGHELPERIWGELTDAILKSVRRGEGIEN